MCFITKHIVSLQEKEPNSPLAQRSSFLALRRLGFLPQRKSPPRAPSFHCCRRHRLPSPETSSSVSSKKGKVILRVIFMGRHRSRK
ncbi:hypothetical protein I3843_15G004700 [Carya illinoinensis]|nr:hypothetical protein I3843_15G004700 [Carya illinoinensis]